MINLTPNESFVGSGVINAPLLESIYQTIIGETFQDLGRDVVLHLKPITQQDTTTQSQIQPSQVNPYFGGRVPIPQTNTRNSGKKITYRDVTYQGHIKIGPMKEGDDSSGMGDLKANEAVVTLDIGALGHLSETLSVTIEGRRYSISETRPIGFSTRRYVLVKLEEINEADQALGDKDG